jgi:Domain of unknown function (DUF5753)
VITAYALNRDTIEDAVAARQERQESLDREDGPAQHFILDEAVIRRWIGGPAVMRAQLESLKEVAERPNVTIQVLPFTVGAHAGIRASFTVYEFAPDDDEDYIVFLEGGTGSTLVRNESGEATAYLERFVELEKQSTSPDQFTAIIDDAINQLNTAQP